MSTSGGTSGTAALSLAVVDFFPFLGLARARFALLSGGRLLPAILTRYLFLLKERKTVLKKKERLFPVTTVRSGYRIEQLGLALAKHGC